QEAKVAIVGLGRGHKLLGDFGHEVERDTCVVIARQPELRLDEFARIQIDQFPVFPLEIGHAHLREPLQTGAERALHAARAPRHTTQLALLPGQKTNHKVRFLERVGSQDDGFAYTSRHTWKFQSNTVEFGYWEAVKFGENPGLKINGFWVRLELSRISA